ncbi:MAG: hypothetical protein QOJ84_1594 [Bradyrhizobium sp.]|jgi:hypothetical protein|nr:hypothetical protein [Bradyrhizobium sp.]
MRISDDNMQFHKSTRDGGAIGAKTQGKTAFRIIKTVLIWTGAAIAVAAATTLIEPSRPQLSESGVKVQSEARREKNPSSPNAIVVYAAALNAAPGAIVCNDYATVMLMFQLYTRHWTDRLQDAVTKGQSQLLRGAAAEEPDPEFYGCLVVQPGTAMLQDPGNAIPVITVQRDDGSFFKGVTMAPMVRK